MGKNNKKKKTNLPFVSICTPTYNRRPFIPIMFQCFHNQTYPKDRIEWIIVDDGTDKIEDLIKEANIPQIKYFQLDQKMTLGAKRNYMHSKTSGSILVYMDDDDYYPPERVEHSVETLQKNPEALCAGSSEIYVYFKHLPKMYQGGPYNKNHATAGTFAFRRELLDQTKYNENASLAEEKEFLKNYTIPFAQMDPLKTILVFSHNQNTFDKRKLLDKPTNLFKPCEKTVEMFIRNEYEKPIKDYFLKDIDAKLEAYKPGDPIMKPDVLKQLKELEAEREKLEKSQGQIMMQRPGEDPRPLSSQELVNLIQTQQKQIKELNEKMGLMSSGNNEGAYQELDRRGKQIQILDGLVNKLKDELKDAREEIKTLQSGGTEVKKTTTNTMPIFEPLPTPPALQPLSFNPLSQDLQTPKLPSNTNPSKLLPEIMVLLPIEV